MPIRERLQADLDACAEMAREVHDRDGYPLFLPDDLRGFIAAPDALRAWVAEEDGEIVGHVVLNPRSSDAVMALASGSLGLAENRLAVVARLLVSPHHRRRGLGRDLLEVASGEARARGLWPVLDAVSGREEALRLYDACGWVRVGEVKVRWGDHHPEVVEVVFTVPAPASPPLIWADNEVRRGAPHAPKGAR